MIVFVHSIAIIWFKFLFVDRLGSTATLKRCYPAYHLIVNTTILFMKLEDLHGQVMVKNEIGNIISDQIICVNLNAHVDVNSDPTLGRNMYLQPCINTENCQS